MIDGPLSLLACLRAGTRNAHERLESISLGDRIMDGSLDPEEYRQLIEWQTRAHRLLEYRIANFTGGDYRYRSRFPLAADRDAGVTALPEAVGILYVLEGASLGGSVIYRKLTANPRLAQFAPFPFYRDQSAWGVKQWKSFVAYLQTLQFSESETERAAKSAVGAFKAFESSWQ